MFPVSRLFLVEVNGRHAFVLSRPQNKALTLIPPLPNFFHDAAGQLKIPLRVDLSHVSAAMTQHRLGGFQAEPMSDFCPPAMTQLIWCPSGHPRLLTGPGDCPVVAIFGVASIRGR